MRGVREDALVTQLLDPAETARLRALPLTYRCVGGTATGRRDPGYHPFSRVATISSVSFDEAVDRLMTWQVHERAGLRVTASAASVETDAVVLMRLGLGAASLKVPCRVVHVIHEADRVGFAYGTLPGHPETGEEQFVIERSGGETRVRIDAFSLPSTPLARLAGPFGRRVQRVMTQRYLRAAGAETSDEHADPFARVRSRP
jgi:uncharacterized protein (UPF0548 family)